ncbi:MAG: response regulator transcription factor [Saprospiraceae bacterium]|nr:response regulator transcription factor [Saprospiraceae bacterium]
MIKCVAIDDEPKALDIIRHHMAKIDFAQLEATFTDPFEAIKYLNSHTIDLLLLDIQMPDINGIQVLDHLASQCLVIFTTAFSEHASKSYELNAVDYLLKPFDFSRLLLAMNKVRDKISLSSKFQTEFFFVNSGNHKRKLRYQDILFVKSEGNYVVYQTITERIIVRATIMDTLNLLPPGLFIQIHRSNIVSLNWIDKVVDNHVQIGEHKLPISAGFREAFMKFIGE